ncbi:unnamed protein product [Peniophora sp. CBMAI 1063]|nr:unnamed protein product [Peniophora sp. CBMAI 1063]
MKRTGIWKELNNAKKRLKRGQGGYAEQRTGDIPVDVTIGRNDAGERVRSVHRADPAPTVSLDSLGDLSNRPSAKEAPHAQDRRIEVEYEDEVIGDDAAGWQDEPDALTESEPLPPRALEGDAPQGDVPQGDKPAEKPDAKKSASRAPIWSWIGTRMDALREILRLDGRAEAAALASENQCRNPKCKDKRAQRRGCIVKKHADMPLHRVEIWLEGHWQEITLKRLGVSVNFGHNGKPCPQPRRTPVDDFVILHTNGIHEVRAVFCGCTQEFVPIRDQLMRARWWPATSITPQSGATFECLDAFDALAATGKTNAYEYYNSLCHLSDATGLHTLPDRYKEFGRMAHEWRHILQCKRAGRGHDRFGGLNTDITEQIAELSPELLDALPLFELVMLAMDCNFRARNRANKSTDDTSPMLGDGMAYMVPDKDYDDFTEYSQYNQEMSTCSKFGAMILANLKKGKGYRTTGIGGVFCSRHGFWWPNSVGTLVKGERYCTMDYILASVARRLRTEKLHLSYDIICQYARHLEARLREVQPDSFIYEGAQKLLNEVHKVYAVPKFHNPGHKELCQQWFNLALQLFCGQTDGEASERAWAGLNPAATSMREMGPGTMRDTIDFYCGMWNWRKTIGLGPFLLKKLEIALAEADDHCDIYTGLREVIEDENKETLEAWLGSVIAWENRDEEGKYEGRVVPNPYKPKTKPISLHQARLRSAQAMNDALLSVGSAAAATQTSEASAATPDVTNFILLGFKIELMRFRNAAVRSTNTVLQKAERTEQKNELLRHVQMFRKQQQWIMPLVYAGLKELQGDDVDRGEGESGEDDEDDEFIASTDGERLEQETAHTDLWLPSELPRQLAMDHNRDVLFEEIRLRWGGLSDTIIMIRQNLQIRGVVHRFRKGNTRGQRPNTRARGKQAVIEANLAIAKAAYRLHRVRFKALAEMLSPEERAEHVPHDWESRFQILEDSDCVALGSKVLLQMEEADIAHARAIIAHRKGGDASGNTHHKVSWLWYTTLDGATLELNDEMRVEFLRCRARAMRWVEEVYHLSYEMARTPQFAMGKAEWWAGKALLEMPGADPLVKDGTRAYARKQSTMFRRQCESLQEQFAQPLQNAAGFVKTHGLDGLRKT